jgi:hypothetical protein
MIETSQQNRHQRAIWASVGRTGEKQSTVGHDLWFEKNHELLTEHAPAEGPDPVCTAPDCGKAWPCGIAETAMCQVGVHS